LPQLARPSSMTLVAWETGGVPMVFMGRLEVSAETLIVGASGRPRQVFDLLG
jgi:hypothetical protein